MALAPSREVLNKVRKLALLPGEVRQSRWAVPVTRLTSLKSLCQDPEAAYPFVIYLARKTLDRLKHKQGRTAGGSTGKRHAHRQMMADALAAMEHWIDAPTEAGREVLWELLDQVRDEQNEYERIKWGSVRLINDRDLLLFEYALQCLVHSDSEVGTWAYQMARRYADRHEASKGTGLVAASTPLLQDIADFWLGRFGLNPETLVAPVKKPRKANVPAVAKPTRARFTDRQEQLLAFIHLYFKLHGQGPAEHDLVRYFRVTPPTVHSMIVKLAQVGLITRQPGVPRSARVAIPPAEVPDLKNVT